MGTRRPLRARTMEEAHLYMELHPCPECGSTDFFRRSRVVARGDDLVSVTGGPCAGCGTARSFEFLVPEKPQPPTRPFSFGGPEPSALICPGQFLAVADVHASRVPADPAGLPEHKAARARRSVEMAAAAIEEVLKFIPPGTERLDARQFTSESGRAVFLREPGRFRRPRLEAVLGAYRGILSKLGK